MTDTCPICGDEYKERHEYRGDNYEGVKDAGDAMEALTDDIHVVEVENRVLVFYVHAGVLVMPGAEG